MLKSHQQRCYPCRHVTWRHLVKIFVHGPDGAREHDADAGGTIGTLLVTLGGDTEALLWLEEQNDPLDPSLTLTEAGVVEFAHLHHNVCRDVAVTVRFGGEDKARMFPPSASVQAVFSWAVGKEGFNLPADQRAKHTLGLCGTQTEADRRDHVGTLATECRVCFDLAPKARYQG
jgi:hypothetical protein